MQDIQKTLAASGFATLVLEFAFAVLAFFLPFCIADTFSIIYYPTIDRLTILQLIVLPDFSYSVLASISAIIVFILVKRKMIAIPVGVALGIIAIGNMPFQPYLNLVSIITPFAIWILTRGNLKARLCLSFKRVAGAYFIILIFLSLYSLARWLLLTVYPARDFEEYDWIIPFIELQFFYLVGLLSPYLLLASSFSYLYRGQLVRVLGAAYSKFENSSDLSRTRFIATKLFARLDRIFSNYIITIIAGITLSVLLSLYPYNQNINVDARGIGVDIVYYVEWLKQLDSNSVIENFQKSFIPFGGDRPLTLFVIKLLLIATGTAPEDSVKFLPLILAPVLALVSYYVVYVGTGNKKKAALACFVLPLSYTFIVGTYAGFYANWFALITGLLAFAFSYKMLQKPSVPIAILLALSLIGTLLFHIYTWVFFSLILAVYAALSIVMWKDRKTKFNAILLLVILAFSVGVDYLKMETGSQSGIQRQLEHIEGGISAEEFARRWNNLNYVFHIFVGGFFTNTIALVLVAVYALSAKLRDRFNLLILLSIFVAGVPLIMTDVILQTRIIYDIPIQIPMALTLYSIMSRARSSNFYFLISAFVVISLISYSVRSLANMYLPLG